MTLNLKSKQGRDVIQRLVAEADVLVENYVPGKLDELGLGWDQARQWNPRLVQPMLMRVGEAGLMHITGQPDGEPVKVGVAITDLTTGLYTKGAVLAALYAREKTGLGQKIDVSLLECQVASLANIGSNFLVGGQEAKRMGTAHGAIVPYQSFPTLDGHIVIGSGNDSQYTKFCRALEREDLIAPRFATNQDRVRNRSELIHELCKTLRTKPTRAWLQILDGVGIPFGPVNNIQQTFEHPQVVHRAMIQEVDHPTAGRIKVAGIPVKYSLNKPSIRLPPPLLGQHTDQILQELGYTSQEVAEMRANKVIA
ncbi:hypothetical protein HDU91_002567 [Kappamyces sp. JEL0680]|nr:hypothetical protein HDU91_002567 [Kappamyces sp. JEL0680]